MKKIIAAFTALFMTACSLGIEVCADSEIKLNNSEIISDAADNNNEGVGTESDVTSLSQPEKLVSKKNTVSSNTISWEAVENAEGYEIYYWRSGNFVKIGETAQTEYTNKNKSHGTKYMYKVKAYCFNKKGEKISSPFSKQLTTCTLPDKVTMNTTITSKNSLKLRWQKVSKATGYSVYMYKGGKWVRLADTSKTEYNVGDLTSATAYRFKVRAYRRLDGVTYTGSFGNEKKSYTNQTVKTSRNVSVKSSGSSSSKTLATIPANTVLSKFGAVRNGWIDIKIPGTNSTHGWIKYSDVKPYNNLNVNCINQNGYAGGHPMPMGCEATSLATVLNYIGFSTNKNYISDRYVPSGPLGSVDPNYAFTGSPYSYAGLGVYAPVIAQAANNFISDRHVRDNYVIELNTDYITGNNINNEKISPSKLSLGNTKLSGGLTSNQIKHEIDEGHPVIVWMATNGKGMYIKNTWTLYKGSKYTQPGGGSYRFIWYAPQHCLVITGYDDVKGQFIFGDVLTGAQNRRFSYGTFESSYKILGRQSVVIYKK